MPGFCVSLLLSTLAVSCQANLVGLGDSNVTNILQACRDISDAISPQSELIGSLSPHFGLAIHHWFQSSTQIPACVLNAGDDEDVSTAIKIIAQKKVPFAFKSGGHATNPGFSSTVGVHIWPGRMSQVNLSPDNSTVELGMGQAWIDVYKKLDGTGIGVTGGRVPGPGVGGFALGGGFSWFTNQYGLTVDTVKSYNLVLPNGTITRVDSSQPDLFFALKGGLNRFGLVTSVELYTHTQNDVWAGIAIYSPAQVRALLNATAAFDRTNRDPKTQMITTLIGLGQQTNSSAIVLFFHDGVEKPDIFSLFDRIPAANSAKRQSFYSFTSSVPSTLLPNDRGAFATMSVTSFTSSFSAAMLNENNIANNLSMQHDGGPVPFNLEIDPFMHDYGQHATDSAFPHADSPLPLSLYYSWTSTSEDDFWLGHLHGAIDRLRKVAQDEGIYHPRQYPNYAYLNATAENLYGEENAARLRKIRKEVDPDNVMDLAGGFVI